MVVGGGILLGTGLLLAGMCADTVQLFSMAAFPPCEKRISRAALARCSRAAFRPASPPAASRVSSDSGNPPSHPAIRRAPTLLPIITNPHCRHHPSCSSRVYESGWRLTLS